MIKKIRNFYAFNKGISRFGIISFLISLSYMITYNMPDYFGIEPFYSWINNISISYLAAMIFYIFQVYIPEERDKKKCNEILANKFCQISKYIEVAILVCEKHIKIKDRGAELLWNGGLNKLYINYSEKGSEKASNPRSYTYQQIMKMPKVFEQIINEIKESTVIKFCDYEILELLSGIEEANFFHSICTTIVLANSDVGLQSFNDTIKKMRVLNGKIKEKCSIKQSYQLLDVSERDRAISDALSENFLQSISDIKELNVAIIKRVVKNQIEKQGISVSEADLDRISRQIADSEMSTQK